MEKQNDVYKKDKRIECKFGVKCYQKNPLHHEKYKHPPKKRSPSQNAFESFFKKQKTDNKDRDTSMVNVSNAISDSDDDISENSVVIKVQKETGSNYGNQVLNSDTNRTLTFDNINEVVNSKINEASTSAKAEQSKNGNSIKLKLETLEDKKQFIKEKFLVEMPDDFYTFWDFCCSLNKNNPCDAFSVINMTLVGPYDVLADKFSIEKLPEEYLIHWRYFHDPPEFQTVLKGSDSTGYHIGYFRDDPSELPTFMGSNSALKGGEISLMGDNIFAAVGLYLEEASKSSSPFQKMAISKLQAALKAKASKLNLDLSEKTAKIRERHKKVLTRSFNRAGVVVPYNRKTQLGYRHLCIDDKELKRLLDRVVNSSVQQRSKVMSELQPILTATDIATDECDFGTGLELGWNILSHEVDTLNSTIEHFLCTAYDLLQRPQFAIIAKAHMAKRRKGANLSVL